MALQGTQKPHKGLNSKKTTKYTHIGVEKPTRKIIALLATVRGSKIKSLVGEWADEAWAEARKEGLVTDAMLAVFHEEG